jgi:hypothetical protein
MGGVHGTAARCHSGMASPELRRACGARRFDPHITTVVGVERAALSGGWRLGRPYVGRSGACGGGAMIGGGR